MKKYFFGQFFVKDAEIYIFIYGVRDDTAYGGSGQHVARVMHPEIYPGVSHSKSPYKQYSCHEPVFENER